LFYVACFLASWFISNYAKMETKRKHKFSALESKGIAFTWDDILQVLNNYFHVLALQRKVGVSFMFTPSLLRNF